MSQEGKKPVKEKKKPPPRLFVLLARNAPVGVILRRGPSKWVQMIKWHTDTDTFEAGQWIRARVYETSSHLSPNGEFIICDIRNDRNRIEGIGGKWTAVSKPPYFAALAVWTAYSLGAYFVDDITLRIYTDSKWLRVLSQPTEIRIIPDDEAQGFNEINTEVTTAATWQEIQRGEDVTDRLKDNLDLYERLDWAKGDGWLTKYDPSSIIRRQVGTYAIEQHFYGHRFKSGRIYKYGLVTVSNNLIYELKGANWADFDQQGRLVLARDGKLFSAALQHGEMVYTELADFNANKPEPVEAPDWAQRW